MTEIVQYPHPFKELPEGTVTFLFTDIEGSTQLLSQLGDRYATLLDEHHQLMRATFTQWHGREIDTQGDAFFVAFPRALDAVSCVVEAQRALVVHQWPGDVTVRVRMGLHTGEPIVSRTGYVGMDVHRAARIAHVGHGGQVLLSETTTALVIDELPEGAELLDLGRHLLKDMRRPEHIRQLVIEGLPAEFPPLTSLEHLPPAELRQPRQVGGCPYRGLAAFREDDAPFFHGREVFTERLYEAVRTQPMVAVIVGSSGSGKSSAVFAGLLPHLRGEGSWGIAVFRPGSQPFYALGDALLSLLEPDLSQAEQLVETAKLSEPISTGEVNLIQVVERVLKTSPATEQVLLVIDEFEELYTLCPDGQTQRRFIDSLLAAVESANAPRVSPLVVLLTMRADFMGQALTHRPFADALQEASLIMGPMNQEELRAAIEKPAEAQGAAFEPGLVERLLDDVGQEPGNLPLMEFALTLLWERQSDGWLTHADYEALGCVEGSLASYADEVFAGLDDREKVAAHQIFVQLVRPGEGTEDTRRVATQDQLGAANWDLIQYLADKRLVVTGRDASSGDKTVEVVHEALIQRWERLQDWMTADRAFRTWQERLRASMRSWQRSDQDEGALLRGAPLAEAEGWLVEREGELSPEEVAYIQASVTLREHRIAMRERRRRRVLFGLAGGLAVALLLALLAGVQWQRADEAGALAINRGATAQAASTDAIAQRSTAQAASTLAIQQAEALATSRAITEQEARLAGLREIATAALNQSETDPQLSLLLALYAIDQSDLEHRTLLPQVEGALHRAVQAADSRQRLSIDTMDYFILQVTFNAGGDHVVASGTETGGSEVTKVYDASSGELLANLPGRYATQTSWPDESNLVTLNQVPSPFVELTYWDTYVSEVLTTTVLSFPGEFTIQQYWANKFDPSGDYFALGSIGRGAGEWSDRITDTTVWNLRTEQVILNTDVEFDQGKTADPPITFAPDGQHLLMATLDDILIWTVESGAAPNTLIEQSRVFALEISPDGKLLATTSTPANTVILWDLAAVRELVTLPHTGAVVVVAYSPNGKLLATDCGGICIWDIDTSIEQGTGRLLFTLSGHGEGNYGFDFDPSGNLLVSVGPDSTIKVWDLTPGTGVEGSTFASAAATGETVRSSIALSPDGGRLAFANSSQDPLVWDTTNQQILFHLRAHNGPVEYIEYCPDGAYIATGGGDGKVMIWDGENGQLMLTLEGFSDGCCQLDFSPDGKSLAVGVSGAFSTIQVYELDALLEKAPEPVLTSSGDEKFTIYAHEGPISGMAFYPDNSNLTTCGIDGQVEHWDPETGGNLPSTIPSAETYTSFAYNQDGSLLALGDETGQLKLWDVKAAELLYTLSGHSEAINAIAYHPKGKRMATASDDGTLLIWDIEAGQGLFMLYEHEVSVTDLIFSPEGKYLYAVDSDGFVRTYLMEVDDLIALGLERLTRDFTEQECRQYLHLDQCPGGL